MSVPTAPVATRAAEVRGLPSHLQQPGSKVVRWLLTAIAVLFLSAFIIWPVFQVFRGAFSKGVDAYVRTFYAPPLDPEVLEKMPRRERVVANNEVRQAPKTRDAIAMTATVALIVVPLNTVFGLAAAWAISKFRFRGKTFLISLIDLPFSVSPVVAGLIFVLLMGRVGIFGDWATHIQWPWPWSAYWRGFEGHWWPIGFSNWYEGVIFTPLATALASTFVTFPFVARALLPLMESQGTESEQAAITLGANGKQTFRRVTLPAIKWGLLYGIILCTARAIGEFGAVSVVSGSTDANDTMPLRIEKIWQSYNTQQAFAVASLLASVSIVTLLLKVVIDRKQSEQAVVKKPGAGH
ncbi:MAG TPA: ABC transporter permease subunit [Tepidisphaeraceae bacterium]|jgi:sulfate transport system permease protein